MAKDETSPGGLFSKMVKFVRSPGTQWNDLDDPSSAKSGGLSKHALKEMIERKRRNDFVRKREFDMLRKLRRREATGGTASDIEARPSFFQSSMPSRPDDRAQTLKKIDEIEAQMSMQWWKTKHGTGAGPSSLGASSDFSRSQPPSRDQISQRPQSPVAQAGRAAYAPTAPDNLGLDLAKSVAKVQGSEPAQAASDRIPVLNERLSPGTPSGVPRAPTPARSAALSPNVDDSLDFTADIGRARKPMPKPSPFASAASSQPTAAASSAPKPVGLGGLAASYDSAATSGFSASKIFAIEVDDVQHDPELEEAAIRFANGDDENAEAGLVEAISGRGSRHQHEETWLTLFDLYRATGQYERFESLAIDFANLFSRSAPGWFSIPEMVSQLTDSTPPVPSGPRTADWKCPAVLGLQSLAALNAALAKTPMPWTLDWSALQSIDEVAVEPLTRLFAGWAGQLVQLRLAHADQLESVMRKSIPSGDSTVDQRHWNVYLAYMRMMGRPDEFELAALDFCVTYEVSPPSWEAARCEVKRLDLEGNTGVGQTIVGNAVHDSMVSELHTDPAGPAITTQLASVELSGQIMGEPGPVLDKLEARLLGADVMLISCAKLVRVDFSAAGSLLNWVSARQAEGRVVHFSDTHRLVAAFFHVIGISEHAKVSTRAD
jgi:ABC-type transporter Mla MlaB component